MQEKTDDKNIDYRCENCKHYWAIGAKEGTCFCHKLITPVDDWCPDFEEI